jgi:hypothetical protein
MAFSAWRTTFSCRVRLVRKDNLMSPRWPEPAADEGARLLRLLRANDTAALTIAAMHEDGIRAPAQAIYALQLAGYDIDRVYDEHTDGLRTPAYRLRSTAKEADAEPLSEFTPRP